MEYLILVLCLTFTTVRGNVAKVSYTIIEESPNGTVVGNIVDAAGLSRKYTHDVLSSLEYNFHKEDRRCLKCFTIGKHTAEIQATKAVDRDVICPGEVHCVLIYSIIVKPVKYMQFIQVEISLLDLNDNAPKFDQDVFSLTVSEATTEMTTFPLSTATDPDSPLFGVKSYEIVPSDPKFDIKYVNPDSNVPEVQLILMQRLDRETDGSHRLTISCIDGGNPPNTGTMTVSVSISDYNDNRPLFKNNTYIAQIPENESPGAFVISVTAVDRDIGANGKLRYSFDRLTTSTMGDVFRIDESTGNIYTKQSLDHEDVPEYHLTVIAKDSAPVALSTSTKVHIIVTDLNDNSPQITINNAQDKENVIRTPETNLANQPVGHISIIDADTGTNGQFKCSLNDKQFELQHMFESEYKLVSLQSMDRESKDSYRVTITCVDSGRVPRSSDVTIDIKVLDINDHAPQFDQDVFQVSLLENTPKGTSVFQVSASDSDISLNGAVSYKLANDAFDMFIIEPDTGIIKVNDIFDYERTKFMTFHVVAVDHGKKPLSASCSIELTILDANDEKPHFIQTRYTFPAMENEGIGVNLGKVTVRDKDSNKYNKFTFHLQGTSDTLDKFKIDELSGNITTKAVLDREITPRFNLRVVAVDQSAPHWTTTARVTILVGDINDNAPVIDFPNATHQTIVTSSKNPIGSEIGTVLAHDLDDGQNAKITFSLENVNIPIPFSVHPVTGRIKITTKIFGSQEYTVTLSATDNGNPPFSNQQQLTVKFNDSMAAIAPSGKGGRSFVNVGKQDSSSGGVKDNMVLIIALSVVFTLIILALAALLITLRCVRRKHNNSYSSDEATDTTSKRPMISTPRDFPEGKEHSPITKSPPESRFEGSTSNSFSENETNAPRVEGRKAEKRKRISFTSVHNWLQTQPDPVAGEEVDVESHASEQLSNSDSGRGTEEGEVLPPGSRDTSTEYPDSVHVSLDTKNKKVSFSEHVTMCDSMDRSQKKHEPHPAHSNSLLLQNAWKYLPKQQQLQQSDSNSSYLPYQREPPHSDKSGQWSVTKKNVESHNQMNKLNQVSQDSLPKTMYRSNIIADGLTSWYQNAKTRHQSEETCSEDGSTTTSGSYVMDMDGFSSATVV